jgi:transposase-like protein
MKFPALCPRCKQGPDLHRITIEEIPHPIFVCYECDATYEKEEDIRAIRFRDYSQWATEKGLDPNPTDLRQSDD